MNSALQSVPFFENPSLWRYASDAMKTTFRIFVPGGERPLVDSAVSEAFQKLEELEGVLSRHAPGSDISRINAMEAGETLFLSDECDRCLRLTIEASAATGGRFDPCAGTMIDAVKSGSRFAGTVRGVVSLDEHRPLVKCLEAGRVLDLGAIGKGFALERMGEILAAHGIADALLTSGASTILAMGSMDWPIDIPHSAGARRLLLRASALAASGNSQQGAHIVNPATGEPACHFENVWVIHPRAPFADAFSTACFTMTPEDIADFTALLPAGCRVINDPDWNA
jgi:thiamine biosynthesis lipoprotein